MGLIVASFAELLPFAVIPTFTLLGPATILGLLFPAACGGTILFFRRWKFALTVVSVCSLICLLHSWLYSYVCDSLQERELGLWISMSTVVTMAALLRYRRSKSSSGDDQPTGRFSDALVLALTSLCSAVVVGYASTHPSPLLATYRPLLATTAIAAACGLGFLMWQRSRRQIVVRRIAGDVEVVVLWAAAFVCAAETAKVFCQSAFANPMQARWTFRPACQGFMDSTPLVIEDSVFAAVAIDTDSKLCGELFCLNRLTGQKIWSFNNDGKMKPVFSSPRFSANRIYIGEGFHSHRQCQVYCIDASTGLKLWDFVTQGHTESTPCVVDERVYIGAGDDGLYCLDADTGRCVWHFEGPHVDGCPSVADNGVYAGSGYAKFELFCIDAMSGHARWRVDADLPCFASATVNGDDVYFGIGNGDMSQSSSQPAGALLSLDRRTGQLNWRHDVSDAVHTTPLVIDDKVIFGSRDHHCYCLDRITGKRRWKRDLGSPVVSAPIVATGIGPAGTTGVCVLANEGLLSFLEADSGLVIQQTHTRQFAQVNPQFVSTPVITEVPSDRRQRPQIFVGGSLGWVSTRPILFCLE